MVGQAEFATGKPQEVNEGTHDIAVANEANSLSLTSHKVTHDQSSATGREQRLIQDELKLPSRPDGGVESSSGAEPHLKRRAQTTMPGEHLANRDPDTPSCEALSGSQGLHTSVDESVSQIGNAGTGNVKDETVTHDHAKLRKGQWTVEEQEYSSRIIYYFDKGLLMIPEGTSLRSYLADKLMCDPMRITKKYAGVSWRTKRITSLVGRPSASAFDIEVAKTELACLEHRFRLRISKQTNSLLDPNQLASGSHSQTPFPVLYTPTVVPTPVAFAPSWSQSTPCQMAPPSSGSFPYPPSQQQQLHHYVGAPAPWPVVPPAFQPSASPSPGAPATTAIYAISGEAVALAWAQAAASLTPALFPVAAPNFGLQQVQHSIPHESQPQTHHQFLPSAAMSSVSSKPSFSASTPEQQLNSQLSQTVPPISIQEQQCVPMQQQEKVADPIHDQVSTSLNQAQVASDAVNRHLRELRRAFESQREHYESQKQQQQQKGPTDMQNSHSSNASQRSAVSYRQPPIVAGGSSVKYETLRRQNVSGSERAQATADTVAGNVSKPRIISKDDEDAGSILMGFASLLQQSYDEAQSSGRGNSVCESSTSNRKGGSTAAMSASGESEFCSARTSNPADSSADDSLSDQGGKDPGCSSEESDGATYQTYSQQAPPCKRHKSKIGNFTSQNVAEHTTRMAAMYHAGKQQRRGHDASLPSLSHRNSNKHKTGQTDTNGEHPS